MRINLNQLRSFFLAAREKSITKAAEALYVTQPAVTMQVKSLEQDLDLKLFRKYGKGLELTDAGEVLFGYSERVFEIVEEKVVPYTKEEFCLVVSPQHKFSKRVAVPLSELQNEPIIIRENGSGSRYAILSLLSSHGINPSVLLEAGSVEFIKEYIIKGQGISFLYKPEIRLEATLGLLKPVAVKEGPIFVQTDTIFPRGVDLSPPVKAFLQLIEGEV